MHWTWTTLLSLQNEYKNAVHMSSSADSHFAIEISVIFFLSIYFFCEHIFFYLNFRSQKKNHADGKKNPTKSLICFWHFLSLYFLRIFLSHIFFVVVHNFCVGITISIYFCINLILKVKLWCWMLLLLMSLHWLSFKTVSRNFFTQLAGMGRSYSWLMGCELYWNLCWYEVKIDK